jgi:hypothetical protein
LAPGGGAGSYPPRFFIASATNKRFEDEVRKWLTSELAIASTFASCERGAASVLHAQAKPPAYAFAEIDVKDQDGYTYRRIL